MPRLHTQATADATGHAAQLFSAVKAAVGVVPNAYVDIGSNSPVALEALLNLDAALRKGTLSAQDSQIVQLAASAVRDCEYCLAAHTYIGKKTGLSAEQILSIRQAAPSGDARIDALAAFTHTLVATSGKIDADVLARVRAAGYTDQQVVEIVLAITAITFTNLFNRVNQTTVDFPAAD